MSKKGGKSAKHSRKTKRYSKTEKKRRVRGGEGEPQKTWTEWWNSFWKKTDETTHPPVSTENSTETGSQQGQPPQPPQPPQQ